MPRFSSRSHDSGQWSGTAWHDLLTGALTRQHFMSLLQEEKRHAHQEGAPFTLGLIDIDGLRRINDGLGQQAGDAVLAAVSDELRGLLVKPPWHELEHSCARFDGGSLMLLLRRCELGHARQLAETFRHRVAEAPLVDDIAVTVSIGVAQHRLGEPIDELIGRVERTLHLAKQFGRDRVEAAPAVPSGRRAKVVALDGAIRSGRRRNDS